MMNVVWLVMILGGILAAAVGGRIEVVANAIVSGGEQAITLSLALLAVLSFWMGLARVAERAGLLGTLARILAPLMRPLFPSLRRNPEALRHIALNFAANLLGLGNAATPFGLKAMHAMQETNPDKDTATDAMCTFLVLNTAGMTIIPSSVIALRAAYGSQDPTATVAVSLLAGLAATIAGLIADYTFRKLNRSRRQRGGRR
ncbi:MAG: spore maturation protein [Firmicutes bacterium]|nr:spore maturation protein [Bacillota bacterium]